MHKKLYQQKKKIFSPNIAQRLVKLKLSDILFNNFIFKFEFHRYKSKVENSSGS